MRARGDRGETEKLRAVENGLSVIPHELKRARGFAGRMPGNVSDVDRRKSWRYALVDRLRQWLGVAVSSSETDD